MGKSERVFTFINTKSVGNVQRRVNKGSDMPALVKFLKHRHLLRLLHVTVILSNIRTKFWVFLFHIYLCDKIFTYLTDTDAYSELNETSKMEHFGTIVSTLKLFRLVRLVKYTALHVM